MENTYKVKFIDKEFFEYLSQFTKDTFNCDLESSKLRLPYQVETTLIDEYPDYKNMPEYRNSNPDEIITKWPKPKTPTEALKYLVECDGKLSFLHHIEIFLEKYGNFSGNYLKSWLISVEKKESLSKDHSFINESFEKRGWPTLKSPYELTSEHYYCRLKNDYYTSHPDELLKGGIYDERYLANEFGLIMFYEFANYLLSKQIEQPEHEKESNPDTLSKKEQERIIKKVKDIIGFMDEHKTPREEQIRYIGRQIEYVKSNEPRTPDYYFFIELLEHHLARLNGTAEKKYIYKNIDDQESNSLIESTHNEIDSMGIEVFGNDGYGLFKYLDKNYQQDNDHLVAKYSYIFRFLKPKQFIKVSQDSYRDFIVKYNGTKMSKVLKAENSQKNDNIQSTLKDFHDIFFK